MGSPATTHVLSTSSLSEILDDLCIRFLLFLPEEELSSIERICFQIEEAHWFYEDFIREINPNVPNLNLRQFIHQLLERVPPSLISHIPLWKTETAFTDFMSYKTRVPVRGVIMLNMDMDKVVLVKGWKSGASWSFPRGKIDQNEGDRDCAIRETLEETGFDLTGMVGPEDKIDINIREQDMRLYIAPGVPEDFQFAPRTRKEISKIAWHKLSELPGYSAKKGQREQHNIRTGKFFLVAPFIRELRKWIATNGKQWLEQQQQQGATEFQQRQLATATGKLELKEAELKTEEHSLSSQATSQPTVLPENTAASLENMLEARARQGAPAMTQEEQDDASRRLRRMIGGIQEPQQSNTVAANVSNTDAVSSENPNMTMRLPALHPYGPTTSSHHSPPSHRVSAQPNFMGFSPIGHQNMRPNPSTPMQHPHQPPHLRSSFGPMLRCPQAVAPPPGGWQQGQSQHVIAYPLPSPPPTSHFGPPPSYAQQQARGPPPPVNQFYTNPATAMPQHGKTVPQHGGMMARNGMLQHYGQQAIHGTPTAVDALHPPPQQQPIRPQDPEQTDALLSILKSTSAPVQGVPVATHWQPGPTTTAVMPATPTMMQPGVHFQQPPKQQPPQQQPPQQQPPKQQPPKQQPPQQQPPKQQPPQQQPSQQQPPKQQPPQQQPPKQQPPQQQSPKQQPPKRQQPAQQSQAQQPKQLPQPRGQKAHNKQRGSPQHQQPQRHKNHQGNKRSSTAAPVSHAYPPPPRPTTAQPRLDTPPPLGHGTPVAIDHYGVQKTTPLPAASFDRRESISGERVQALLAMFRKPEAAASPMETPMNEAAAAASSMATPVKDALVASPETARRKPVQRAPPPRLNTAAVAGGPPSRRGVPRTPTEAEKANLLAYLEDVASEKREDGSGGVPI